MKTMTRRPRGMKWGRLVLLGIVLLALGPRLAGAVLVESDFARPPRENGVRCWWWWLNGNVTEAAITRDLEAMQAKGFSGAMIFDAGGAKQRGNQQVPAGPLYGSPRWQELFLHALREGERLGLELGLSIQSGWNLGGPNVTPEFAAKQLTWSELEIEGPGAIDLALPQPSAREGFYRDVCLLAYRREPGAAGTSFALRTSSAQSDYPPANALLDDTRFWVSGGAEPGRGPTAATPEWLELEFAEPVAVGGLVVRGRTGYGPRACVLAGLDSGEESPRLEIADGRVGRFRFEPMAGRRFRLLVPAAYDPRFPDAPRNVQIEYWALLDQAGVPIQLPGVRRPIRDLVLKSGIRELGGSAPDCRFLLEDVPATPGEADAAAEDVLDLTAFVTADGRLVWSAPAGNWTLLRFGYTLTDAHVSTSSGDWQGRVIDYLSRDAFERYWDEVVSPLLTVAGPWVGTTLKQLETDSWECGGMNWSPGFRSEFLARRGYDPLPYLPVLAGKLIDDRERSNAFLADLRKTLGDCVADNHYRVFAEHAHRHGLEIQPESGGPHAGPMDAIKNYGHNDIVMSEFWVPSPHRPTPEARFFVKQAASAAHIYGKRLIAAEAFTSIGPHWEDVLWRAQKPSLDHELCAGLNMVFFHTFTCSPAEMGVPGQEYFAGTHVNPQVTWWDYSDAFIDYINRCQYLTQQGRYVADVLYYYGDHVPVLARLKEDDPAGCLPGFEYDVTNEDVLLRLELDDDGRIRVPGGVRYRVLVLPDHAVLSLAALEKVGSIVAAGGAVLGPKPRRLVSLTGGAAAQARFHALSEELWGTGNEPAGRRWYGRGRLAWGMTAREFLLADGLAPDFEVMGATEAGRFDFIHYRVGEADLYFVSNQTESEEEVTCRFRVSGKRPELWDPLTGRVRGLEAYASEGGRCSIPMRFPPNGAYFVSFEVPSDVDPAIPLDPARNFPAAEPVLTVEGPWVVEFDPAWGGPEEAVFEQLIDWRAHPEAGVRDYSGRARYRTEFDWSGSAAGGRFLLDLGGVEDTGIAAVTLNGHELGIVWTKPFALELGDRLRPGRNELEIVVVNSWRNRLVADRELPVGARLTRTNIALQPGWERVSSGLLGPVVLKRVVGVREATR